MWYAPKGVGQVVEPGDRPSVAFWADGDSGRPASIAQLSLVSLSDAPTKGSPERNDAIVSWVKKSPLKLVAAALHACGGAGQDTDIREKLSGKAPLSPNWGSWWKRTEPKLGNLPGHFRAIQNNGSIEYSLVSSVSEVPVDWTKPKPPTTADWKRWLQARVHETPPGRFPTRPVANALAKWPPRSIEQALLRVIVSAEEGLASEGASAQVAEGWLRAVAQASLRWRETAGADTGGYTAARVGGALARLARVAGDRTPQDLLLQAGALDGETDAWRRGFMAGMWEAFDGEDARDLYRRSSAVLGRQARGDLAKEMFLAAFGPDFSDRRHAELDRLLDALPEAERTRLLQEAIATAAPDQRNGVLGYIADSRHAAGDEDVTLRLMATLSLGSERDELVQRTAGELSKMVAVQAELTLPAFTEQAVVSKRLPVLENIAGDIEQAIADKDREISQLRASQEAQLEQERAEQERLRQQVRERNAELAARREESRLDIRQDMLLAVGEVLQCVPCAASREELARTVEAGLSLALGAGGAELLEQGGAVIDFDPVLHDAMEGRRPTGRVRVLAPGVIVRGGVHGDRVLLKARVKHEEG